TRRHPGRNRPDPGHPVLPVCRYLGDRALRIHDHDLGAPVRLVHLRRSADRRRARRRRHRRRHGAVHRLARASPRPPADQGIAGDPAKTGCLTRKGGPAACRCLTRSVDYPTTVLRNERTFSRTEAVMGVEGKERSRELETGAQVLSGNMGKTIQRLRKAYNLSLSELAEQSGVAKSIISQIERNETNPTLATIWRLSQALDVSIERVLASGDEEPF